MRVEVSALGLRVQGMCMRVLRTNYSRAHCIILVHGVGHCIVHYLKKPMSFASSSCFCLRGLVQKPT